MEFSCSNAQCFPLQMLDAPSAHTGKLGESSKAGTTDEDIERQLAALKDL